MVRPMNKNNNHMALEWSQPLTQEEKEYLDQFDSPEPVEQPDEGEA